LADKLRQFDPLDDTTLIIGLRFSKSVVMHKGETVWIETKVKFERKEENGNGDAHEPT